MSKLLALALAELPTHPLDPSVRAVGIVGGRPVWPVRGGEPTAAELLERDTNRRTELLRMLETPDALPEGVTLEAIVTEAEALGTRITERNQANARAAAARAALTGSVPAPAPAGGSQVTPEERGNGGAPNPPQFQVRERPGALFTESESFVAFRSRGATGTAQIVLPGQLRAVIDNTATSGGAFQNPSRPTDVPSVVEDRTTRIADLIDRRTTDSNTVEYVQDTSTVGVGGSGNPAEVAEGTLKPESTYTFTVVSEPVRTIAHWVNLTRQSVDDNSMLQGYVEGRLAYGLEARVDSQIINGSGVSPNLKGILNVTGINTYTAGAGEAAVISVRRAITVGQLSELPPDTVVMSPSDWERIELSVDTYGSFRVSPNVAQAMAPRIWGLTVVPTTAMAALTFLVGAFRYGATLWERQGTTLLMTDSHASNFTSNILTLLAERRAALAVWRPKAFVKGTFATGTN